MPTHSYMSPEPPTRGALASVAGVRTARIDADQSRRPERPALRIAEFGLMAFTAAAGIWCLYEAVRFFVA